MTATATATQTPAPRAIDSEYPTAPPASRSGALALLASWRLWAVSAVIFVPFAAVFFASSAPFAIPEVESTCGQAPPDMRSYSSGDDVMGFLDACGPIGRSAYQNMQVADLLYPAVVGIFLASSLALATRRFATRTWVRWLPALPLAASLFDYLENAFAWLAIQSYPDTVVTNELLGFASAAKTSLSWAAGLALLLCLAIVAVRAVGGRMHPPQEGPITLDAASNSTSTPLGSVDS